MLFPYGEYDELNLVDSMKKKPIAQITLKKVKPQNYFLYDFMFLPDTNRAAYKKSQLKVEQIKQVQAISKVKNIIIKLFQKSENIKNLESYVMKGWGRLEL